MAVLFAVAFAGGCRKAEPVSQFQLRGTVVRLTPENRLATIQHEEIKGWMEAMTMEFPVKDGAEFAKLKTGAHIEATVNVQDLDYWLTGIRVVATAASPPPPPAAAAAPQP